MQGKTFGTNESNYFLFTNRELALRDEPHLDAVKGNLTNDVSLSSSSSFSSLSDSTPSIYPKEIALNRDDLG